MSEPTASFFWLARLLHWTMSAMILAMLFIGVAIVASVSPTHTWFFEIHKPLGIAILILVILRIYVRVTHPAPALPADLPTSQKFAAHASHWLLYGLMVAMPLVGWAMLSAGGYPVMLSASLRLPAILPANPDAFAVLRHLHAYLAYLLFLTFIAHFAAALYHGLIRRDGVLPSMLNGERAGAVDEVVSPVVLVAVPPTDLADSVTPPIEIPTPDNAISRAKE